MTTTIRVYRTVNKYWTGEHADVDPMAAVASGWVSTTLPPPTPPPGHWARLDGDQWTLTDVPDPSLPTPSQLLDQALDRRLKEAEAVFRQVWQSPAVWDFGDLPAESEGGDPLGPAGVQTLQLRDDGEKDDIKNWLGEALGSVVAVFGGAPTRPTWIKTTSNIKVNMTAAQALQVLVTGGPWPDGREGDQVPVLGRQKAVLNNFGLIKAQLRSARDVPGATPADLDAIDISDGYPPSLTE